jgi:ring-1,2-phenylacetyl-CoA epoxidase subunit PaaE
MSIHFHELAVKEVRRETNDCVSISFCYSTRTQRNFSIQTGPIHYASHNINGEEVRRSYSVCSSPLDNELRVAVKKVEHGIFLYTCQ